MTTRRKMAAAFVVILIIIAIAWRYTHPAQAPAIAEPTVTDTREKESVVGTAADNSDAALNRDLSAIDAEIKNLDSDLGSIDAGLNDQPIAQEQ